MSKTCLFILLSVLVGCDDKIQKEDLDHLNGYWEISQVKFPDGTKKEYTINTSIDFIEISDLKGFRKKVQPNITGTYRTSDDAEPFVILEKDGLFLIQYHNSTSTWEEILLAVAPHTFSVKNQENITYSYNRYQPLNTQD